MKGLVGVVAAGSSSSAGSTQQTVSTDTHKSRAGTNRTRTGREKDTNADATQLPKIPWEA